jgi:hypothetical protein
MLYLSPIFVTAIGEKIVDNRLLSLFTAEATLLSELAELLNSASAR